jgi:hydroxymethylglutaryl-CoA lyase
MNGAAPVASIRICEMGPRDGLQNEAGEVPTDAKVDLVERLAAAGVPEIEVGSFVDPRRVPRMADTAEVFRRIERRAGVVYAALVPNRRGLDAALEARADKVSVFASASESFSQRNTNASIAETLARFEPVLAGAKAAGLPTRAYVSCAFGCPDEGAIAPTAVRALAAALRGLGADEIDLSDTIGVAVPLDVERVLDAVLEAVPLDAMALHFHDTRGTAIANAWAGMGRGVRIFDSSCGGLGGCPFAPGATGNLATEDLLYLCAQSGIATGIDLDLVAQAARTIGAVLGRSLPSRTLAACTAGSIVGQQRAGSSGPSR